MEELLTINNLRKGFGGLEVLKDISLHVEKGQVVAIIGPSGCPQINTAALCDDA